jgi:two-component system phosphate regulon sensor histidine kinase PhoR
LIFAVLAAAVALAYYGYSYVSTESDRETEAIRDLVQERILNIEEKVLSDDDTLFKKAPLPLEDFVAKLPELASSIHVMSVFVLDDDLKLIPGGYVSTPGRSDKEALQFRDWFMKVVLPGLPLRKLLLTKQPYSDRGHLHAIWDGPEPGSRDQKDYLFSFVKRVWADKPYYVVIEEDTAYLVAFQFPQYFPTFDRKKRSYQIVDAKGELRYGLPFVPEAGATTIEEEFRDTVDMWRVRVTEKEDETAKTQRARTRFVNSVFIGGAMAVMLAGLLVLVLAIRRERRANELKSEFISNVSHELKTPLSIISMFGEMLANGRTKGPEQSTEYADIIWRESVRLGRLIDNVLDFAKIERGKNVYEFVESDVGEVVERAVDLVGRRLATAEMSIDVQIEPELPQVLLDPNAFTLAVMNLIDNATKYAADGKRIELDLRRLGDRIVLSVRDFGQGIDPQEQEQIFERFYRARAVRLKQIRGSGIGLALVRHIARAHHGDVVVESEPGKGSVFRLWLPIPE